MVKKSMYTHPLNTSHALEIQNNFSARVSTYDSVSEVKYIAGVDLSVQNTSKMATASVVLLNYPDLYIIDVQTASGYLEFPYIPGLLSFRELPLIIAAFEQLSITPDLVMVDGQGIAHPRRFGLASHFGVVMDITTIGCAKSRLCGRHAEPENEPGDFSNLIDKDEIIGVVLRTKRGVKPVFVSIGHNISLNSAIYWVLNCCRGYRIPQPTRLAHLAAGGNLQMKGHSAIS
ncbi:MAG: deoxyribonuclease V [Dehalococcoidales bacterium]|nr:MAG: deoxyribonuclease V [Dehalococcoidales bacterium]